MRECRRVFSRRSLLWLLVLMAAVVFFHRVDHHNAPGFAAAYRQTAAQLAASPDPSAALSQMEAESRRYMTALLWRSTDDPDLLELYRDQARQVLGDDYETAAMAYDLSDRAQMEFTARQQAQQTLRQQLDYLAAYPGYLDTIHENAANMPTLSIFMDSSAGKFHAENVKKTDRDFPRSTDVSLTLTETAGLENFLQDSVVSVCILLWMLVTVLRLTEERRSSLRYLVFGSPRGRTWLALRRGGILGLSAALGTALLKSGAAIWLANHFVALFGMETMTPLVVIAILAFFLTVIHLGFASATGLASAMIPIVIAVLQSVKTPGIDVLGMTMILQYTICLFSRSMHRRT